MHQKGWSIQKLHTILSINEVCLRSIINEAQFHKRQKTKNERQSRYPYKLIKIHKMYAKEFIAKKVAKKITVNELKKKLNGIFR